MILLSKFSVAVLIIPLSVGSIAWSTAAAATVPTRQTSALELAQQTYSPPNNGGPTSTQGSGTR